MNAWVVEVVVDAKHDVECFGAGDLTFYGAGHHHMLKTHLIEVRLQGLGCFELAAAFEHHIDISLAPGHSRGVFLLAVAQSSGCNRKASGGCLNGLMPAAMHRVKRQQMGSGVSISCGIIDVHQLDAGPTPKGTEDKAADATKAVDANFHGRERWSVGRQPKHRSITVD